MEQPRDHIVPVPPYFRTLRLVQLFLTALVLGLSAYTSIALATYGIGAVPFSLFVTVATFIIVGYYLYSTTKAISLYNKMAVLILECFLVIWWMSTWGSLAATAAAYSFVDAATCDDFGNCHGVSGFTAYHVAWAAAAAAGALNFVLFVITLVVFSLNFHRQRIAGAPYSYRGTWGNGAANGSGGGGPRRGAVPMQPVPYDAQKPVAPGVGV